MRIKANNITINYELEGPEDAPVLMLSHSLAANLGMWEPQATVLKDRYRVLRYDMRGHGKSEAPKGPYSFAQFAGDAVSLMDALQIPTVHWVGLSIGGMIGMELGIRHAARLETLTLANTKPGFSPESAQDFQARMELVSREGTAPLVDSIVERWFTEGFVRTKPEQVEPVRHMIATTPADGMIGAFQALMTLDYKEAIRAITTPTLIIAGEKDEGTTVEDARFMQERIKGARLVVLPDCRHLSNIEQAAKFTAALEGFVTR